MEGMIAAAQPYELHGVRYYQIAYVLDGEQQPRMARLSHDMVYVDPQPGDRVDVHAILGIVDRVTRLE